MIFCNTKYIKPGASGGFVSAAMLSCFFIQIRKIKIYTVAIEKRYNMC